MTTTDRARTTTPAGSTRWRPVDVVVASVLGVAGGLLLVLWNLAYTPIAAGLAFYPPLAAVVAGVWLLPGVLGGLVIRKPGAAMYVEVVAAVLSALAGNQWGFATVWFGLAQGLGAEAVFAVLRYRRWTLPVVVVAGAATGLVSALLSLLLDYAALGLDFKIAYVLLLVVSGAVLAGGGSWLLTGALRRTGALAPLASGGGGERV
jgi:energy-coupling factor transport system substrate-specific component